MIIDFSYQDIINQCNTMAYLNVASFCMLSGCGSMEPPTDAELQKIHALTKDMKSDKKPSNIFFMSSLYKRGLPSYEADPASPYDFNGFLWNRKKHKRTVLTNVMSYSISCMTLLAEKIAKDEIQLGNKDFIIFCLLTNSLKQALFMKNHLKIGDFYYNGDDISADPQDECNIEIDPDNPTLSSQFFVLESLSTLIGKGRPLSVCDAEKLQMLECEFDMLPLICENVLNNINTITSKELSAICMSLIVLHDNVKAHSDIVYNTINAIGCELYERIYSNGDIARDAYSNESSSLVTLCNCLNCFARLYRLNSMEIFLQACLRLYDRVDSFWNDDMGLFIDTDRGKMKCSIRDIAYILSALKACRGIVTDPDLFMHLDRQFTAFYRSAFITSKIFIGQNFAILQDDKLDMYKLGTAEKHFAPTFIKAFEAKIKKKKYYCETDVFQSEYVLAACLQLLK